MRAAASCLLAAALAVLGPAPAHAQRLPVGDPLEDYLRVLQVAGRAASAGPAALDFTTRPFALDRALASVAADSNHPWRERLAAPPLAMRLGTARLVAADPQLRLFGNTAYPWGQNDGAVWQGKGLTAALDAGGTLRWGPVSLDLRPTLVYTQNSAFALAPVNAPTRPIYGNPWHPRPRMTNSIDLPQRFGPDAFWTLDPGQSSIRIEAGGFAAGFGTENLWWGPGIQNAILMSNNAPGFPHAFLATARPLDIGIGTVEGQWIWGRLKQSAYFDSNATSTRRYLTGAVGTFAPKFLPGLVVGVTRVFYEGVPDTGLGWKEYLLVLQGVLKADLATPANPEGNDARDQIASIFARWVLPESGFEAYAEWARNDHSWDLRDLFLEPEHSQGYTLGFQKVMALRRERLLRLSGELTHLERSPTFQVRAEPTFYAHHIVMQGYTQRGQVIGAGIGPGGNAQYLGADLFARWGRAGVFIQRQVFDNDAYYAQAPDRNGHDVALVFGASALVFVRGVDVGGTVAWSKEYNRNFEPRHDVSNLHLELSARWRP